MSDPLKIWQEKKFYYEEQLAITSDPPQKFALRKYIQECESNIIRLQSQPKQPTKTSLSLELPGRPYNLDWYIHREEEEDVAIDTLNSDSSGVVICSPPRFGKSTFLDHLLERIAKDNAQNDTVIKVEINKFYEANIQELEPLLKVFAELLVHSIGGQESWISDCWIASNPLIKIEKLMENYVLPNSNQRLFLVIDKTDLAGDWKAKEHFFSMLRSWLEKRHKDWPKLRLLLTLSISPSDLIEDHRQSLFSICETIYLLDFNKDQIQDLAEKHELALLETEIEQIMNLVGGHPFLVRSIMYQAKKFNKKLIELLDPDNRIFRNHLAHFSFILHKDKDLKNGLQSFKGMITIAGTNKVYNRLVDLGLLKQDGNRYSLRYPIYQKLID